MRGGPSSAAAARSRVYGLLAGGFHHPDAAAFAAARSGAFATALDEAAAQLRRRPSPWLLRALSRPGGSLADMRAAHLRFEETCPPYEGHYLPASKRGPLLGELKAFYGHFGLAMAAGGEL
ncbi:MAG: hypothetical protein HQL41_10315, partial [Alphaproteobacteria bacterium]|nr:hypothetical protein [Alphaproteobacteria bacterium]